MVMGRIVAVPIAAGIEGSVVVAVTAVCTRGEAPVQPRVHNLCEQRETVR